MSNVLGIRPHHTPWELERELKKENAFLSKLEKKGSEPPTPAEEQRVKSLKDRVTHLSKEHLTKHERIQLKGIEQQLMAYDYRYDILKPEEDQGKIADLCQKLEKICKGYKKISKLYPGGDGNLTKNDKRQIHLLCQKYPRFAELLIKNNQNGKSSDFLTTEWVKFCLREKCSNDVFTQFPHEKILISGCHLAKRTGAVHQSEGIKVINQSGRKVVAMKMNTAIGHSEWVNILDKSLKVTLPNLINADAPPYELSIGEMFEQFKKKTQGYENVEYVEDGVVNWHSGILGSFDPSVGKYDVLRPHYDTDWLDKVPAIARMNRQQLKEHYPGQTICENGQYGFDVSATRTRADYDIGDCHALIKLIIPDGEGSFLIKPFGLQTEFLPQTDFDRLANIASTQRGAVHTPDESFYLSQRQSISEIFPLSLKEFNVLHNLLGNTIEKAFRGDKIFQAIGNNCANFTQKCHRAVIGGHLIDHVQTLVTTKLGDSPFIHRKLKDALYAFDDEDLEELLEDVVPKLTYAELSLLIEKCHYSLSRTLMKDHLENLPSIDDFNSLNIDSTDKPSEEIQDAVIKLVMLSLNSQHFFRMHALKADYHSFLKYVVIPIRFLDTLLKWTIQLIKCIVCFKSVGQILTKPFQWIRNLLLALLSLLLGSIRWRKITSETHGQRYKSVITNKYHWRKTFNLPCAMWYREGQKPEMQERATKLVHGLLASMNQAIPAKSLIAV